MRRLAKALFGASDHSETKPGISWTVSQATDTYARKISCTMLIDKRFMKRRKTNWAATVGGPDCDGDNFGSLFFMQGEVKVDGSYPRDVKETSLICESTEIEYPFFTFYNAKSQDMSIKALFDGRKMKSISLVYNLYYDGNEASRASETHNHADMNISFGKNGLSTDEFSAVYSAQDKK